MSKIGRKPIELKNASVEIKGQDVHYKGPKATGVYSLPNILTPVVEDGLLFIKASDAGKKSKDLNRLWGLHRAILANKIKGADQGFEKKVEIIGLGFKAALSGSKITFSLGYSHKIDFDLPKEVVLEVDKSGQKLLFKSSDKELLGYVCSKVKSLRLPEPYKGTGIRVGDETILRKAGKTKS